MCSSGERISKFVYSDPICQFVFERKKGRVYLVGGCIRDIILGHHPVDIDFAIKGSPLEIAREISNRTHGSLVVLDNFLFRVVTPERKIYDFTKIKKDISYDLSRRDFTINSIAWSPTKGIIDPYHGLEHIDQRVIKAVDQENILRDPVRIIRAYRISAETGFRIEKETREYLREYSRFLRLSSPERITQEMIKMINIDHNERHVRYMIQDKILSIISGIKRQKLLINFKLYQTIAHSLSKINDPHISEYLRSYQSQDITGAGLIRLGVLLRGFEPEESLLLLSNINKKRLLAISETLNFIDTRLSMTRFFDLLYQNRLSEQEIIITLYLIRRNQKKRISGLVERYRYVIENPLISGREISEILGQDKIRETGRAKHHILRLQFLGRLRTRAECVRWMISNFT